MDDALLDLDFGVTGLNGFREAGEAIDTSDQNILDASVLQISQHAEPVMSALSVRQVQADQLFLALNVQG